MTRLRVLFAFLHSERSPGPRYRALQFVPYLTAAGFDCTAISMQSDASTKQSIRSVLLPRPQRALHHFVIWMQTLAFQLRIVRMAKQFDRVVLHRVPLSRWARWLLRARRTQIINDFDDALDAVPEDSGELFAGLKRRFLRRGLENAILAAATSITSNTHNGVIVERLARRAVIIPTSIDLSKVTFRDRATPIDGRPVIGWIGTPSTALYLRPIEDALREIAERHSAVIRLVGAGRSPFSRLAIELAEWSLEREDEELRRFDVGLMPMPDTAWTRGKAALKALQYGASGAPTVASFTPTNVAMLGENAGTVFVRSGQDWVRELDRLLQNATLRAEMGRRGRARVERWYSLDVNAPLLAGVIRDPAGH